jgi:[FeFe] hydrogenase H-cluster maturation GTPase HydF
MSLTDTPRANRLHIGLFGKRNSGKSSLVNVLTRQQLSVVSDIAGTTTDPVYKSMEIYGIGPCVFIDTAGFDDVGDLGAMRVDKTKLAGEKTDIALVLFSEEEMAEELKWANYFKSKKIPVLAIINKADILKEKTEAIEKAIKAALGQDAIVVSAKEKQGVDQIRENIIRLLPEDYEVKSITGGLANDGDTILLIMPQDIQAPKGRLILPQVQTLRDLLDKKCLVLSATADKLDEALDSLKKAPDLIITDSQVFPLVYDKKPKESKLTSFSILFANYKGDLAFFTDSAKAIDALTEKSHVLIAEACTHVPLAEDIGRVKIPRMLQQKISPDIKITTVNGADFPEDLSPYDLVIHCGACMFNRRHVLSRAERARQQNVPMTNYGVVLAHFAGILDKIDLH